jgi:uncharacterized protein (TIGR00269 family)
MQNEFTQEFENKVKKTIDEYVLVEPGEKIIVACSGGKDSTATLYILKKLGYDVEGLMIDLIIGKWSDDNLENTKKFCKEHGIKLNVVNMRKEFGSSICYIRSGIQAKMKLSNCAICGVIKRWILNKKARELGGTKIATGHNLDDEVETIMMNIFAGNPELSFGMGPKNGVIKNDKFVQRIKPLYFITNKEVRKYSETMNFPVLYDPCPCSINAFRRDMRKWITDLQKEDPKTKMRLVKNFLRMIPVVRENYKSERKIEDCNSCGEPSNNKICKRCELIEILGDG